MTKMAITEPRVVNDVTIIGPGLFERDDNGVPLSPIATAFPGYRALVTSRGIHALHVGVMLEFLEDTGAIMGPESYALEEGKLCRDAVSLFVRDEVVLIRSDPKAEELVFAADEMLQQILPKRVIQFTGPDLMQVRRKHRQHGESWRISPAPRSVEDVMQYIRSSMVHVHSDAVFYQNASSGERFLTYEEFMHIRPLLAKDKTEAMARLKEIQGLLGLVNNQGASELCFFLPRGESLKTDLLDELIDFLEKSAAEQDAASAKKRFDRFASDFAGAAGPDLMKDASESPIWRNTMFCLLAGIKEDTMEEAILGLSPEFHLNVRWLPGAVAVGGKLVFEPEAEYRLRCITAELARGLPALASVNVGRVESSQTARTRIGEEREVYLAVLGLADGRDDIRIVRRMKWDVLHRLKQGMPLERAIDDTLRYRNYIFDRLRAISELGISILSYGEIRFSEKVDGWGEVPMVFFERPYVPGMTTEKIPLSRYGQHGFVVRLAGLLGGSAAVSLMLGRVDPRDGHLFFDDGDEVIQFDRNHLPERLVLVDTTGSFADWTSSMAAMLPQCLKHLSAHLQKARQKGAHPEEISAAVAAFAQGLAAELERVQNLATEPSANLYALFGDRTQEPGGIRKRWEAVLHRLHKTDIRELVELIMENESKMSNPDCISNRDP